MKWLIRPAANLPESELRRSNLLSYLHLFLLIILAAAFILVLIANPPGSPRRTEYHFLITILTVFVGLAYGLNRTGHYILSAILTVLCAFAGPWGSIILDPLILQGDFRPPDLYDHLGAAFKHSSDTFDNDYFSRCPVDNIGNFAKDQLWHRIAKLAQLPSLYFYHLPAQYCRKQHQPQ